jgi:excisionase family DNA binding protein
MKTGNPLLVSLSEASFQLDIPIEDVQELIRDGELPAVRIRQHLLIPYESLVRLARRYRRASARMPAGTQANAASLG